MQTSRKRNSFIDRQIERLVDRWRVEADIDIGRFGDRRAASTRSQPQLAKAAFEVSFPSSSSKIAASQYDSSMPSQLVSTAVLAKVTFSSSNSKIAAFQYESVRCTFFRFKSRELSARKLRARLRDEAVLGATSDRCVGNSLYIVYLCKIQVENCSVDTQTDEQKYRPKGDSQTKDTKPSLGRHKDKYVDRQAGSEVDHIQKRHRRNINSYTDGQANRLDRVQVVGQVLQINR